MNNFAVLFPGQGSQTVGMLQAEYEQYPIVKDLFLQASNVLEYDLWDVVANGPAEKLNQTIYTQPAMLVADIAMWHIWRTQHEGDKPKLLAGHSLGEYAALVRAKAITFVDAVNLVDKRARLMQEAVPSDQGAMAVILGLDAETVKKLCIQISTETAIVEAVNFNAPLQTVIAGIVTAVDQVIELAKSAGAKRAQKLPISIPSHCQLLKPAASKFADYLNQVAIQSPAIPVINNVDVATPTYPDDIRDALMRQLYSPVRWVETVQYMVSAGITEFVECGPGKVLTGLIKRLHVSA